MKPLDYINSPKYRPDLDGLRAIAIILVILTHAFPSTFSGGFIGVDIFFVISGFLISGILYRQIDNGSFSFWDFYAKRARRIFPALIFLFLGAFLIGALLLTPREFKELGQEAFYGSVFIENIRMARGIDYFGLNINHKPLMHLWSLGVEEQYYLIFPVLIFAAWKWLKGRLGLLLISITAASFFTELYWQPIDESKAYFWPHCRFWQLGAGALLSYCLYRSSDYRLCAFIKHKLEQFGSFLSASSILCLLVLLFTFGSVTATYPGYWAIIPTLCAILIIGAGKNAWINRTLLANPFAVYIGWLSYPMYLWHWLFLSVAFCVFAGQVPLSVTLALVALMYVFAYISFRFIEAPIRRLPATKFLLFKTLFALIGAGAIGGVISLSDGLPQRLSKEQLQSLALIKNDRSVHQNDQCSHQTSYLCWSHKNKLNDHILFLGNSHTEHLANMLIKYAPKNIHLDIFAAGGTRPLWDELEGFSKKQLIRHGKMHDALHDAADSSAKMIVISNTWGSPNDNELLLLKNGSQARFHIVFENTLKHLMKNGKKVVFLVDNPNMPNEMENCLGIRPLNIITGHCSIPRSSFDDIALAQYHYFNRWAQKYPDQVFVINSGSYLCDDQTCYMKDKNGRPLFTDLHHLSDRGSEILVQRLWPELMKIYEK